MEYGRNAFGDDPEKSPAATTSGVARTAPPASEAAADAQFSCGKRLGMSYLTLGIVFLGIPAMVYIKGPQAMLSSVNPRSASALLLLLVFLLPGIVGNILRLLDTRPAVVLLKEGLFDNAWLFPLGRVRWDQIARCELTWNKGVFGTRKQVRKSSKTLRIALSRPDEILDGLPWTASLGRRMSYTFKGWKDIQIPAFAVTTDLATLKEEIERRLAAHRGSAPQEAAQA